MSTISKIIAEAGGPSKVAESMGVPTATVATWTHRNRVPAERVAELASAIGVSKAVIRPDIFTQEPGQ